MRPTTISPVIGRRSITGSSRRRTRRAASARARSLAPASTPVCSAIGAVVVAGVLVVPIALAFREDPDEELAAAGRRGDHDGPDHAGPPRRACGDDGDGSCDGGACHGRRPGRPERVDVEGVVRRSCVVETPAPEPKCAGTYTVIANDYWNRFPKSSGASVQAWLAANNATADTPLYVGDELCIPVGATAPGPPPTTQAPAVVASPATTPTPVATDRSRDHAARDDRSTRHDSGAGDSGPARRHRRSSPDTRCRGARPRSRRCVRRSDHPRGVARRHRGACPRHRMRESKLNPSVHNWCCYGVFAIYFDMGGSFLPQMGITSPQQLLDARTNITAAYKLYTLAGWKPWAQTDPG